MFNRPEGGAKCEYQMGPFLVVKITCRSPASFDPWLRPQPTFRGWYSLMSSGGRFRLDIFAGCTCRPSVGRAGPSIWCGCCVSVVGSHVHHLLRGAATAGVTRHQADCLCRVTHACSRFGCCIVLPRRTTTSVEDTAMLNDTDNKTQEEIKALTHELMEAMRKRDEPTLDRILSDDFVIAGWQPEGRLG